jgi:hypothetical protein
MYDNRFRTFWPSALFCVSVARSHPAAPSTKAPVNDEGHAGSAKMEFRHPDRRGGCGFAAAAFAVVPA